MDEASLYGLDPLSTAEQQHITLQYFERLKADARGWKICGQALLSARNDQVKFFCFQVIEDFLKIHYATVDFETHLSVRELVRVILQQQCDVNSDEKLYVHNKAAQIFALCFTVDYPVRWPQFFSELLQCLNLGLNAVDFYLRVLLAINTEVVDREIAHTDQELERNTYLKDAIRESSITSLVDSWYQILDSYGKTQAEITSLCLDVISVYISWIDLSLIVNDRFIGLLMTFLAEDKLRCSVCMCVLEIVQKGMDPSQKLKLIQYFMNLLVSAGIFDIISDDDFQEKLAQLLNGIALQLTSAYQKSTKDEAELADILLTELDKYMPLLLRFSANEDDDVASAVVRAQHEYISTLRMAGTLTENRKLIVNQLLMMIMQKMKYDVEYNFEKEGENEIEFQEYRKELKVVLNQLGSLAPALLIKTVYQYAEKMLRNWHSSSVQEVELSLLMIYILGEAIPSMMAQVFTAESKFPQMTDLLHLLVESCVYEHPHPVVALQFFETVVRYDKFFNSNPAFLPQVLMSFLNEHGLRHDSPKVRSRGAYLFSRFVKDITKSNIQDFLEEILRQMTGLIYLHSPENGIKHYISSNDQLFLYEAVGILIVHSSFEPEKKSLLMQQLLTPILSKFNSLLEELGHQDDPQMQEKYADIICQAMSFASRSSKGFSAQHTMQSCGCVEIFSSAFRLFLNALKCPVQSSMLHAAVRQYIHRMVVCLNEEVLPFIPVSIGSLLHSPDAKQLYDFIPLINQLIAKFKVQISPYLKEIFMEVVYKIFEVLQQPISDQDLPALTDQKLLHRSYFSFLAAVVNNGLHDVLSSQAPQNLEKVMQTLVHGAVDVSDPPGQKMCFVSLKKLVQLWVGKQELKGFADFTLKSIVPACFLAPLKPSFDLSDAQTSLVLVECALCLHSAHAALGQRLLQFLLDEYLCSLNVTPSLGQELTEAFKLQPRDFKNSFKYFIVRLKT